MEPLSKEASTLQIGGDSGEALAGIQDTEVVVVEEPGEVDSHFHRMVRLIICQVQEAEEEGVHFMVKDTTSTKGHHKEGAGNNNTLKVKVNTSFSKEAANNQCSAGITMHLHPEAITIIILFHQEEVPVEEEVVGEEVVDTEAGVRERKMAPILKVMLATRH